jgi:hypothetical protein
MPNQKITCVINKYYNDKQTELKLIPKCNCTDCGGNDNISPCKIEIYNNNNNNNNNNKTKIKITPV